MSNTNLPVELVNAVKALAVNNVQQSSERSLIAQSIAAATGLNMSDAWCQFKYPSSLSFDDYYLMYDRGAIANGTINMINDKCFETYPEIIQGEEYDESKPLTPWEKQIAAIFKKAKVWSGIKEAELYKMVGGWSGLLLQYRDDSNWDQAVDASSKELVRVIPAWSGQLKPEEIEQDAQKENYGNPEYWTYREAAIDPTIKEPKDIKVHKSRIVIFGKWRSGKSLLRPVFNNLLNIEKMEGGSAESFLKNASRHLSIEFDKDVTLDSLAQSYGVPVDELQGIFDQVTKSLNSGRDSTIVTQGGKVAPITTTQAEATSGHTINLQAVAAGFRVPMKIIVGMQTGERASTEDIKQFNNRCKGLQDNEMTDDIELVVKNLQDSNAVAATDFAVIFDDLTESTQSEKIDNAGKLSKINKEQELSAEGQPFTNAEIRTQAGFENEAESKKVRGKRKIEAQPINNNPDALPEVDI